MKLEFSEGAVCIDLRENDCIEQFYFFLNHGYHCYGVSHGPSVHLRSAGFAKRIKFKSEED